MGVIFAPPGVSQQFVEELCSPSGLTDGLLREIERVIFEAHPDDDRDGALDFEELLEHRVAASTRPRARSRGRRADFRSDRHRA